jgi:hypothetical protein
VVEGTNLRSIPYLAEGIVDITRIKTNNIHAMLMTYGVEAARATIIQEIANVFALYSINVNVRHLMLIADYMVSSIELEHDTGVLTMSRLLMEALSLSIAGVSQPIVHHYSRHHTRQQWLSYPTPLSMVTLTI